MERQDIEVKSEWYNRTHNELLMLKSTMSSGDYKKYKVEMVSRIVARVDSFQFGSIVINGRKYGRDVLLFPDGTVRERKGGFWKFGSHAINRADIEELVTAKPEVLVVGTGTNGRARVTPEAEACAREANIGFTSAPSSEAVRQLNQLIDEGRRVSALTHITC